MIHLDANCLMENQLARSMGLDKYAAIMEAAKKKDVSSDDAFQHAFNAFYRVRRNAEWRKCYYQLTLLYNNGRVLVRGLEITDEGFSLTDAEGGGGYVPVAEEDVELTEDHG